MKKLSSFLISQYSGATKLRAILDNFEAVLEQSIGNPATKLKSDMGIKARGIFLDLLGKRFGVKRPVLPTGTLPQYFGLVEGESSIEGEGTFSQAPFVPDATGYAGSRLPASDDAFALLIRMVAASLRNDGTHDSITAVLAALFEGSFIVDNQDMTATLYLSIGGSLNDKAILYDNMSLFPRPAGVKYNIEQFRHFGFSNGDATFDNGPFWE